MDRKEIVRQVWLMRLQAILEWYLMNGGDA